MGFRFRKSFGAGPFRVNLSKSGIGYSFGGKGFRVTKKARGGTRTTASIPGTGISYTSDSKKRKRSGSSKRKTSVAGFLWKIFLWTFAACFVFALIREYWTVLLPLCAAAAAGYFILKKFRKKQPVVEETKGIEASEEEETAPQRPESEVNIYDVAGVFYHKETLIGMMEPNYLYKYKKQDLIDLSYTDEAIYKDTIENGSVEIVPEPTNPHDPNAIKVLINGNLVGYIPAKDCAHLLSVIRCGNIVSIAYKVRGGKYKIVNEDYDCIKDRSDYTVDHGEDDYGVTLYIREKF